MYSLLYPKRTVTSTHLSRFTRKILCQLKHNECKVESKVEDEKENKNQDKPIALDAKCLLRAIDAVAV